MKTHFHILQSRKRDISKPPPGPPESLVCISVGGVGVVGVVVAKKQESILLIFQENQEILIQKV